jgi:transposase
LACASCIVRTVLSGRSLIALLIELWNTRSAAWRGSATRYEEQPGRYLAAVTLAGTLVWPGT